LLQSVGSIHSLHPFPTRRSSDLPFLAHRRRLGDAEDPNVAGSTETADLDKAEAGRYAESARAEFISRLPESLGTNVIAISSDLRSEEHTSELQSRENLVCRLLLE